VETLVICKKSLKDRVILKQVSRKTEMLLLTLLAATGFSHGCETGREVYRVQYDRSSGRTGIRSQASKARKLMLWGNRNGFFYLLDRTSSFWANLL
jgi:hypothetical protein